MTQFGKQARTVWENQVSQTLLYETLKANIYASTSTGFVLNGASETIFQIGWHYFFIGIHCIWL